MLNMMLMKCLYCVATMQQQITTALHRNCFTEVHIHTQTHNHMSPCVFTWGNTSISDLFVTLFDLVWLFVGLCVSASICKRVLEIWNANVVIDRRNSKGFPSYFALTDKNTLGNDNVSSLAVASNRWRSLFTKFRANEECLSNHSIAHSLFAHHIVDSLSFRWWNGRAWYPREPVTDPLPCPANEPDFI